MDEARELELGRAILALDEATKDQREATPVAGEVVLPVATLSRTGRPGGLTEAGSQT